MIVQNSLTCICFRRLYGSVGLSNTALERSYCNSSLRRLFASGGKYWASMTDSALRNSCIVSIAILPALRTLEKARESVFDSVAIMYSESAIMQALERALLHSRWVR